jgi:hypothetical protein
MFDSGTPARAAQGFFGALLPFFASPELPWRPSRVRREPISPPTRAVANRRAWRLELRPTPLPPFRFPSFWAAFSCQGSTLRPAVSKGDKITRQLLTVVSTETETDGHNYPSDAHCNGLSLQERISLL